MVFVTVKHGANEQTLFNQDCRCVTLLNAIREKCCRAAEGVIDLSDKDGNVKDLRKYPNMAAREVLADREDVVLLKVGQNDKGKLVYTPLLDSDEIVTKAFLEKLAKGSKRESNQGKSKQAGLSPTVAAGGKVSPHASPLGSRGVRGSGGLEPAAATSSASSFDRRKSGGAAAAGGGAGIGGHGKKPR